MFTVKAKKDITIRAFDIFARKNTVSAVTIYTRRGNYQVQERRNGWDVVYQDTIRLSKDDTSLEGLYVEIAAGSTQSFFVYVDAGLKIKSTANAGQPHGQDESIILYSGTAFRREFYNQIGYGQLGGAIRYEME
jgi:hypothetical protein